MPLDGTDFAPSSPFTGPALEMLRIGRRLIETHGLARGKIQDLNGRFCTVGGITRQTRLCDPAITVALEYLARAIPADLLAMAAWNDAPDRSTADVLAAYDRAIDLAIADLA